MKTLCALFMALHAFVAAHFHAQHPKLEFEVASVHPTPPSQEHGMSLSLTLDASQVRVIALPLRDIIAADYRVKPYQISGPDWITTTAFDISAKMPAGATIRQVPEMLQTLLGDRFGLVLHREKKELPVYALVAAAETDSARGRRRRERRRPTDVEFVGVCPMSSGTGRPTCSRPGSSRARSWTHDVCRSTCWSWMRCGKHPRTTRYVRLASFRRSRSRCSRMDRMSASSASIRRSARTLSMTWL